MHTLLHMTSYHEIAELCTYTAHYLICNISLGGGRWKTNSPSKMCNETEITNATNE
jgi:hypothetical protein